MTRRIVKVAITGTHSTGKSTFLDELEPRLQDLDLKLARIGDIPSAAARAGFPILRNHTFESTLWLIAECMRQEAVASLKHDVILVDRPVSDALGYLRAALHLSQRELPAHRLQALLAIVEAHTPDYDVLIATQLDLSIPLGPGRDPDNELRRLAAEQIELLTSKIAPSAWRMTFANRGDMLEQTIARVSTLLQGADIP
ncbi:AAA family ATPase [Bradyrhizobium elkanii]|uniref:AAA family ATPase n=1 Tax=Bradyrhizobium elkanii TaxID=29448 RepID=UPI001AED4666|nr:AAA family ATPase [Bradyrhizobium elkanii]